MKNVVVLGATGTLGLPIARYLHDHGYHVWAVGHSENGRKYFEKLGISYSVFSIEDTESFRCLPQQNVDAVVNYAGALPAVIGEGVSNLIYPDTIVRGVINVLEYMRTVGCKKLVFPQSVFDIHPLFGTKTPIPADAPRVNAFTGDHAIYVTCKNAAVDIIRYYENTYGIRGVIVRTSGVYTYHPRPYILENTKMRLKSERVVIHRVRRGLPIEIWGDPDRVLESISVDDYAQVVEKAIAKEDVSGIFNAGSGGTTLRERLLTIREVFAPEGSLPEVTYCPEKMNCFQYVFDISKTKEVLGYEPACLWRQYCENLKRHMEEQPEREIWGTFEQYEHLLE